MDFQTKINRRHALKIGATATTAMMLAGCGSGGSGSNGSQSNVLQMWVWAGASIQQNSFKAIASTYPNEFKNVKLNITTISTGDAGVAQQLSLALAAHKNIPDLLMLNYTEVPQFAQSGVLEDISSLITPVKNDLYAGALNISSYNGKYIAFPYQMKSKLFYYRADLFEKAGIDVNAITTADSFIEAGHKFHAKFPRQYIMNLSTKPAGYLLHELFSAFSGTSFSDKSGHYDLTTNPAFSQSLGFLKQIHDSGIAFATDDFSADWPAAIKNESVCGFLIANWMKEFLPGYATSAQSGKWKVKTWPTLFSNADEQYGSDAGGSVLVVPTGAPNKDLALQYLSKYLLDKQGALATFNATGNAPVLKSIQSSVLDAINTAQKPASTTDEQWKELPKNFFGKDYYTTEFASYDLARAFNYDPSATKEFTILSQWVSNLMQGKASVADALAGAQHDMQTQINNPYQQ